MTINGYYSFDPATGIVNSFVALPTDIIVTTDFTLTALSGGGTSEPIANFLGYRSRLWVYDMTTRAVVGPTSGVTAPDQDIGTPYLSADAHGGVYVFDDTGFHQYLDTSAIPEPSTLGLAMGAGVQAQVALSCS